MTRSSRNLALGLVFLAIAIPVVWAVTTTASNDYGTMTADTHGKRIEFTFSPSDRVNCDKIVFAQTVKRIFKNGGDVVMKPGDYFPGWKFRDKNVVPGGTSVDHKATEADPYYNGDDVPEDSGTQGKRNAAGKTDAKMSDGPSTNGFWPPGKTGVRFEFETCAMCGAGAQAGTVYGCMTWKVEETKGHEPGTASVTSGAALNDPSASFRQAMDLFDENNINEAGRRYCPD